MLAGCADDYSPEILKAWTSSEPPEGFCHTINAKCYLAFEGADVVGFGVLDLDSGTVEALFVHPSHMGRGIGRMVLKHFDDLACKAGLRQLSLDSSLNAVSFYRACGFIGNKLSTHKSQTGVTVECIPMTKSLGKT